MPLLLGGDELGRTQNGNNNAYCQDNELNWTDWSLAGTETDLSAFVADDGAAAPPQPGARPRAVPGRRRDRLVRARRERRWSPPTGQSRMRTRSGSATADGGAGLLINSWWEPLQFTLPELMRAPLPWLVIDTTDAVVGEPQALTSELVTVGPRSLVALGRDPRQA